MRREEGEKDFLTRAGAGSRLTGNESAQKLTDGQFLKAGSFSHIRAKNLTSDARQLWMEALS